MAGTVLGGDTHCLLGGCVGSRQKRIPGPSLRKGMALPATFLTLPKKGPRSAASCRGERGIPMEVGEESHLQAGVVAPLKFPAFSSRSYWSFPLGLVVFLGCEGGGETGNGGGGAVEGAENRWVRPNTCSSWLALLSKRKSAYSRPKHSICRS